MYAWNYGLDLFDLLRKPDGGQSTLLAALEVSKLFWITQKS